MAGPSVHQSSEELLGPRWLLLEVYKRIYYDYGPIGQGNHRGTISVDSYSPNSFRVT